MTLKEIIKTFLTNVDKYFVRKKDAGNLGKHYSVIIDFSKSDPGGMISYADDVDRAPMSLDWFDILGLKLCVLKEGKVLYYLDPDNVTRQINGSPADITTLGNDVMLEVPRMGTNCMWLDGNRLKITITTAPNRSGYDYRAFSLHRYNDCDKIYIGRYEGYATGNKLYSSNGKAPTCYTTLDNFRTYAHNRGAAYTDIGICDNILLQCLYLLIVKNFNSQTVIGRGIADDPNIHNTGEANTFGWLNTKSSNKNNGKLAICCLGIENFWGNTWAWEDGCIRNANRQYYMAQYADQYNTNGTGYEYICQASPATSGYMCRVAGLPKFIFMQNATTTAVAGSETTYMCDFQWINESITVIPGHGAMHQDGSCVGAFSRDLDNNPANGESWSCTRLVYKHVEGGGA